jgi:hypothetical protein
MIRKTEPEMNRQILMIPDEFRQSEKRIRATCNTSVFVDAKRSRDGNSHF